MALDTWFVRRRRLLRFLFCSIACVFDGDAYQRLPYEIHIGLTITRTGESAYKTLSLRAWNGFLAARKKINRDFVDYADHLSDPNIKFRIRVRHKMYDDKGRGDRVELFYRTMLENDEADFYMAPYLAAHTLIAARLCNEYQRPLIVHQEVTTDLFTQGFKYLLSTNVAANVFHVDLLRRFRELGADSIAVSCDWQTMYHIEMCNGVVDTAEMLGYSRIFPENRTEGGFPRVPEMADYISSLKNIQPEVFVAIDDLSTETALNLISRTLSFNPDISANMNIGVSEFTDNLGGPNSLNIVGPTPWHKNMPNKDNLFGNASKFADYYRENYNEEPTHQSASAAAAVEAILVAVLQLKIDPSWPWIPHDVFRNVFKTMEIQTLFGNLSWNADGSLNGVNSSTEQAFVTVFNRSHDIHTEWIRENSALVYPQLPWLQKELALYPCDPGYIKNYTWEGELICSACPEGMARSSSSLVCLQCGNGYYSDVAGLDYCKLCKAGMNCSADIVVGSPAAEANWYRIHDGKENTYWRCSGNEGVVNCLGNNTCFGVTKGVLCAQCDTGYTNRGLSASFGSQRRKNCRPCGSLVWSWLGFVCLILVHGVIVAVLAWSHQSAIYSLRSISEVFLKIYVNYLQFHGIVLEGSKDLLEKVGLDWLEFISDLTVNPIDSFISSKCLADSIGIDPSTVVVILALMTLPSLLCLGWLCFFLYAAFHVKRRISKFSGNAKPRLHVLFFEALAATQSVAFANKEDFRKSSSVVGGVSHGTSNLSSRPATASQDRTLALNPVVKTITPNKPQMSMRTVKSLNRRLGPKSSDESFNSKDSSKKDDGSSSDSSVDAPVTVDMTSTYRDHARFDVINLADDEVVQRAMQHWVMFSHIVLFLLHVPIIRTLLAAFTCRQYDTLRLEADLDIECMGRDYANWFSLTALGVVIHGIFIPLYVLYRLCKIKHMLLWHNVRRSYGFLFNGYEPPKYYFEVVTMLFKTLMLLALACPDATFRNFLQTCVVLVMQGITTNMRPWDDRAYFMFDKLEAISQTALSSAAMASLAWHVMDLLPDSTAKELVGHNYLYIAIFIFCVCVHLTFQIFFFQRFIRHNVTKYLVMLREYFPDKITFKDHVLLACYSNKLHHTELESAHVLNITALNNEEKQFVKKALFTTLNMYMQSHRPGSRREFRLDCLGPAMLEAFKRCQKSQRGNVRKLLLTDHEYTRCGKIMSIFDDIAIHKRLREILDVEELQNWRNWLQSEHGKEGIRGGSQTLQFKNIRHFTSGNEKLDLLMNPKRHENVERNYQSRKAIAEDFQLALMVSWPSIRAGESPKYYKYMSSEAKRFWTELFFTKAIKTPRWEENDSLNLILDKLRIARKLKDKGKDEDSDEEDGDISHGGKKAKRSKSAVELRVQYDMSDLGFTPVRHPTNQLRKLTEVDKLSEVDVNTRKNLRRECREFFVWSLEVKAKVRHLRSRILCEDAGHARQLAEVQSLLEKDVKSRKSRHEHHVMEMEKSKFGKQTVSIKTKISNCDYDALCIHRSHHAEFKDHVKEVLANAAGQGVLKQHVAVKLSKGSIAIDAAIDPPDGTHAPILAKTLNSSTGLRSTLVRDLRALPFMSSIAYGPIAVAPLEISTTAEPIEAESEPEDNTAQIPEKVSGVKLWLHPAGSPDPPRQVVPAVNSAPAKVDTLAVPESSAAADTLAVPESSAASTVSGPPNVQVLDIEQPAYLRIGTPEAQQIKKEARGKASAKSLAIRPAQVERTHQVRELDDPALQRPAKGRPAMDNSHLTIGGLLGSALAMDPEPPALFDSENAATEPRGRHSTPGREPALTSEEVFPEEVVL